MPISYFAALRKVEEFFSVSARFTFVQEAYVHGYRRHG
jgi:type VI protein secretion system component VasA